MAGAAPSRGRPGSRLLFGWHCRYGTLNAYTGQVAGFKSVVGATDTAFNVQGRNGDLIAAGHGMPRWMQLASQGNIPRLEIDFASGKDVTTWAFDEPGRITALTIFCRVWPLFAAGANATAPVLQLGNVPDLSGGQFILRHAATSWQVQRLRGAGVIDSNFVEPAGTIYPIDLLVTLDQDGAGAGTLQLFTRDSAGVPVLRNGGVASGAGYAMPDEFWAGQQLIIGNQGRYRYEDIRIARGVKTFAQMDALSF